MHSTSKSCSPYRSTSSVTVSSPSLQLVCAWSSQSSILVSMPAAWLSLHESGRKSGVETGKKRRTESRGLGDPGRRLGWRQHGRERPLEDVTVVERVLLVELDGSVQLEDDVTSVGRRKQVDADEIRVDPPGGGAGGGGGAQGRRPGGRRTLFPPGPEGNIRPPLSGSSDSTDGADHRAPGDDDPEVVATRRNELLNDRAVCAEPHSVRVVGEAATQRGKVLAEHDVFAPASEARLDDDRRRKRDRAVRVGHVGRARVGHAGRFQAARRGELVVGGNEGLRPVQHPDAGSLQTRKLPEAVLDPVERCGDVEPADRYISLRERPKSLGRW